MEDFEKYGIVLLGTNEIKPEGSTEYTKDQEITKNALQNRTITNSVMENIDLSGQSYDFGGEEVLEVRNEEIEADGHNLDHNGGSASIFRVIKKHI